MDLPSLVLLLTLLSTALSQPKTPSEPLQRDGYFALTHRDVGISEGVLRDGAVEVASVHECAVRCLGVGACRTFHLGQGMCTLSSRQVAEFPPEGDFAWYAAPGSELYSVACVSEPPEWRGACTEVTVTVPGYRSYGGTYDLMPALESHHRPVYARQDNFFFLKYEIGNWTILSDLEDGEEFDAAAEDPCDPLDALWPSDTVLTCTARNP